MWVLGIDTTGLSQSVVLLHSDGRSHMRASVERRQQGEIVHGFVRECLTEANISLKDLGGIACVTGPGSFTGLRIGIAMAQGFARALECPLAGYDRFTLLRQQAPDAVIVLDSLRAELFVQFDADATEMLLPADITAKLNGRSVVGDGAVQLGVTALTTPSEATLAAQQLLADITANKALPPAAPLYIRPPDVTFPKAVS